MPCQNAPRRAEFAGFLLLACGLAGVGDALDIGARRELFLDRLLIERLAGAELRPARPGAAARPWIRHSRFEDFAAGTLGDSGANLLLRRSGAVEMIHRWDLNNDGYLDLFVGQDHDNTENADIFVYWGTRQGPVSILPELARRQPLARLLREIRLRENGATRLPSAGGGRTLLVDLNGDRYLDIVFCNFIHNYSVDMNAFIYWGSQSGYHPERRTELPTLLAGGLAAADFNRDGYVDLAFSNRGIEGGERFGFDQHRESYIYWNGPAGLSRERRSSLPTVSAIDCAAGDFNADGYPDLLFANNNSAERSFYLYWGGPQGFSKDRRDSWTAGDVAGLRVFDVDRDGRPDLIAVLNDNKAQVWRGNGAGFEPTPWVELPTLGATECRVGDLNRDGHPDLVVPNRGTDEKQASYVYWGSAQGYSASSRLELPTEHAGDAALADFNSDGWIDLAFANQRDGTTCDTDSYIYWNGPQGFHPQHRKLLQGFGPVNAAAADLNRDGHPDLVLINRYSGSDSSRPGSSHSFIYWGNAAHHYSTASLSLVPGTDRTKPSAADLDGDGWVDIVLQNGWIYWGGPASYSLERRTDLGVRLGVGTAVADLNRDGYLDLVFTSGAPFLEEKSPAAVIFFGGAGGYRRDNSLRLPLHCRTALEARAADLDKDGFLDLVFSDADDANLEILYGDKSGFRNPRRALVHAQSSTTVEIADLNADGWLDLILPGGWDRSRFGRPTRRATVLWGGAQSFSLERSLKLEAYCPLDVAVADLNKDGHLDLVMSNYHAYTTRSIPAFVYWGGPGGAYSQARRSSLSAESSSAVTVADLNQDGWLDLVIFNHVERGDHGVGSNIYWGGPHGYSYDRRHWLPTFGPHFGVGVDVGNIYTRRLEEEYTSAALECPAGTTPMRLGWKGETPHGTSIRLEVRTARTEQDLRGAAWRDGSSLAVTPGHRWMQYRAILATPDGGSTPVLTEVVIEVKDDGEALR